MGYGGYTHAGGFVVQGLVDLLVEVAGGIVTNWEGAAPGGHPIERLLVAGDPKLRELAVAHLANSGGGPDGPTAD